MPWTSLGSREIWDRSVIAAPSVLTVLCDAVQPAMTCLYLLDARHNLHAQLGIDALGRGGDSALACMHLLSG